jgi:hypothetical protein
VEAVITQIPSAFGGPPSYEALTWHP